MATANGLNIPNFTTTVADNISTSSAQSHVMEFRLTATSGSPAGTNNATAVTTIYMSPFIGNLIALYDGASAWNLIASSETSIAVPATTNQMYDVFCYNNAGVATLELLAWASDNARSTALTLQDGVLVKTGDTTRRWVGCMRTTSVSGQTEDSPTNRLIYNFYNKIPRNVGNSLADATWTWSGTYGSWRAANGNTTTNAINLITGAPSGFQPDSINLSYRVMTKSNGTSITIFIGIAKDGVDPSTGSVRGFGSSLSTTAVPAVCFFSSSIDTVGYHSFLPYEYLDGSANTATFSKTIGIVGAFFGGYVIS